ncbi:septum formation protein Maf [Pseudoprevotella muciniphila]|uniref:dTTP/UTP pyrophosphatase n=1 Tax=Pseudoprevotella muciniphila TaxID=2133944 RepID=A0A5P8E5H3_9BACT|nr:Maf family nucleotide pyrophosphatase [Pseudoprevotella muciniphila]QFQ12160.1 septum formation protein Maf [Pseudoprevotella muciniphila]
MTPIEYNIILASNSPRRKQLLEQLGLKFSVRVLPDIDETWPDHLRGEDIVRHISTKKAEAYRPTLAAGDLVITADTSVMLRGKVLGKPADKAEAKRMLAFLAGKTHKVMTGVTVMTREHTETIVVTTKVTFAPLSEHEIDYYVERFNPIDKAGAYGIQEWIGMVAVERIEGSYWNVIGLPVQQLYRLLKKFGI